MTRISRIIGTGLSASLEMWASAVLWGSITKQVKHTFFHNCKDKISDVICTWNHDSTGCIILNHVEDDTYCNPSKSDILKELQKYKTS